MTAAEVEVYRALTAASGITDLVGLRIYPDIATQGAMLPLIVYERRSSAPVNTIHDGLPAASKVSVALSAWAKSRIAAEALGDAMEIALRGEGVTVNRFGHYDDQTASHAAVIDFEIWEL